MTLTEFDLYFNSFLRKENFSQDPSQNGIQIMNSAPNTKKITKVAFAVDACVETAKKAAAAGAQLLFVHHGIFWGKSELVTGVHYHRISEFLKNDIALYASHIPLDANQDVGNNYGLARRIGLGNLTPFGVWKGMTLGVKGTLQDAVTVEDLISLTLNKKEKPFVVLPFGKKSIKTVAIISGGAGDDADQAAAAGVDAYITGEIGHEDYHKIEEMGLTVIAGGHYNTETVGVNLVKEKLEHDKEIKTVFIDVPTNL